MLSRKELTNLAKYIKAQFDFIPSEHLGYGFQPIETFVGKKLYPDDFQVFTEVFGHTSIGSTSHDGGYQVLNVDIPTRIDKVLEKMLANETILFDWGECLPDEEIFNGIKAKNVFLVANDNENQPIFYLQDKDKLKLISEYSYMGKVNEDRTFIHLFVDIINSHLEYTGAEQFLIKGL